MATILESLGERVDAVWRGVLLTGAFPSLSMTLRCPLPLAEAGDARADGPLALEATLQVSLVPLAGTAGRRVPLCAEPRPRRESAQAARARHAGRRRAWNVLARALRAEARRDLARALQVPVSPRAPGGAGPGIAQVPGAGGYPAQLLWQGDRFAMRWRALLRSRRH